MDYLYWIILLVVNNKVLLFHCMYYEFNSIAFVRRRLILVYLSFLQVIHHGSCAGVLAWQRQADLKYPPTLRLYIPVIPSSYSVRQNGIEGRSVDDVHLSKWIYGPTRKKWRTLAQWYWCNVTLPRSPILSRWHGMQISK